MYIKLQEIFIDNLFCFFSNLARNSSMTRYNQNVMLVGMASEISNNYTYKCVDCSRHNGIKGANG